jgi:hypothetical protein
MAGSLVTMSGVGIGCALRLARQHAGSRDGCIRQELAARVMPHQFVN